MFREYPYLNLQDLNLDYILRKIREMQTELNNFVVTNAIKYADPIDWNITTQYEKNTVVIDANSGIAYLSVQPVPSGVAITNTNYWTVVFDLSMFIDKNAKNLTDHVEGQTNTATFNSAVGDWLIWYDELYKVTNVINAGDAYVVGSNIERLTVEDVIKTINTEIVNIENDILNITNDIGDLDNLTTTDKTSVVNAINELGTDISNIEGNIDTLEADLENETINRIQLPRTLKGNLVIDHFRVRSNNGAYLQGACYVGNGVIVAYYRTIGSNTGALIGYDIATERKLWEYSTLGYHGNTITYNPNNNKIYICAGLDDLTDTPMNLISIINMANPSVIESTVTLPTMNMAMGLVYDIDTDRFYATHDTGNTPNQSNVVTVFNNDLTSVVDTITLDGNFGVDYGLNSQGYVAIVNGIIYSICQSVGHLAIEGNYIKDGNVAMLAQLPSMINKCRQTGEPQAVIYDYDNDEFYIAAQDYNSTAWQFSIGMIYKTDLYKGIIEEIPLLNASINSLEQINRSIVPVYVANGDTSVTPAWHLSNDTFRSFQDAVNLSIYYGVGARIDLTSTRDGMTRQTRGVLELKLKNFCGAIRGQNASTPIGMNSVRNTPSSNVQFTFVTFEDYFDNSTDSMQIMVKGNSRVYFDRCTFDDFTPAAGQTPYHIQALENADVAIQNCIFNGTMTDCYTGQMAQKRQI